MHRTDYVLTMTCGACPEQYDVHLDGFEVGYLRLRHGYFRADYTYGENDETVYTAEPMGDGIFEPEERNHYLNLAIKAIDHRHHTQAPVIPTVGEEEPEGWTGG